MRAGGAAVGPAGGPVQLPAGLDPAQAREAQRALDEVMRQLGGLPGAQQRGP